MARVLAIAGRFGTTFPLPEASIPGRVSSPLPLSLSGLGVKATCTYVGIVKEGLLTQCSYEFN
jgi:hypothetical protein